MANILSVWHKLCLCQEDKSICRKRRETFREDLVVFTKSRERREERRQENRILIRKKERHIRRQKLQESSRFLSLHSKRGITLQLKCFDIEKWRPKKSIEKENNSQREGLGIMTIITVISDSYAVKCLSQEKVSLSYKYHSCYIFQYNNTMSVGHRHRYQVNKTREPF